jgi:hypothetical protein
MFLHTGVKPHKCTECSETFAEKSGLKSHMLVECTQIVTTVDLFTMKFAGENYNGEKCFP